MVTPQKSSIILSVITAAAEEKTLCIVGDTDIDPSDCDGDGIHDSVDPVLDYWRP